MMAVTYYLFNAKIVQSYMKVVVARSARMFFIYLRKKGRRSARELIKAEMFSTSLRPD
jgi:hypothetical protein